MDAHALGQYLREAREGRELTLDQAEKVLKIRKWILEGFEQGNFNVLEASPVQIRGIIRNYARFLGLDEETVLQFYDSTMENGSRRRRDSKRGTQTVEAVTDNRPPTASRRSSTTSSNRQPTPRRGRRLLNILTILVLAGAALSVIVYVTVQIVNTPPETFSGTPVIVSGILQDATATITNTPYPTSTVQRTPTLFPRATQNYAGQPVLVTVEMRQRAWVRILVDGVQSYAGMAVPGTILEAPGQNEVVVSASSAAAMLITYNGQPQPLFGARGQGVEIIFGRADVVVNAGLVIPPTSEFTATPDTLAGTLIAEQTPSPSPGVSPTPSDTLPPSNTPEPTLTLFPTNTLPPLTATVTPLPAIGQPTSLPVPGQPTATTAAQSNTQPTAQQVVPTIAPTLAVSAIVPPRITPTNATPTK